MEQILVIEDDISLNQGLCRALKAENRQIISCLNLKTAREQLFGKLTVVEGDYRSDAFDDAGTKRHCIGSRY